MSWREPFIMDLAYSCHTSSSSPRSHSYSTCASSSSSPSVSLYLCSASDFGELNITKPCAADSDRVTASVTCSSRSAKSYLVKLKMQILGSSPYPARPTTAGINSMSMAPSITSGSYDHHRRVRSSHHNFSWCWSGFTKGGILGTRTRKSFCTRVSASAASPLSSNELIKDSSRSKIYQEVLEAAREKFNQAISFQSKDKDVSVAKVLLYVAAEDEAFMAFNREMDNESISKERISVSVPSESPEWESVEKMPLGGRNIEEWMSELDTIAKEVEVELISRDIGCHLVQVLEAVNQVLFGLRGYKRNPVLVDSKCSYLHSVLSSRFGSAILISVIYIEVCQRLGVTIVGSRVGEDFLIWPQTGNPEELFKATSGEHSLFATINGNCVEDPKSRASDLTSDSLLGLDIASNRDIIGIALANMIRLYWKRASRMTHGLMLTSPLRKIDDRDSSNAPPLLRPKDLRLAIMASERLLILQPHNWALRRDHGMMLYFNRKYGEAVQELSICMAFAPEEEAEILEPFVEKLHLLRLESSWKSLGFADHLTV